VKDNSVTVFYKMTKSLLRGNYSGFGERTMEKMRIQAFHLNLSDLYATNR